MEEIYKVIDGFENYSISNLGNVVNNISKYILNPSIAGDGYYQIRINNKNKKIHRLVAIAFISNLTNSKMVDHINENKLDNSVVNLRWCTRSQNSMNIGIRANNHSGITGVHQIKSGKWISRYKLNNRTIHIGTYNTIKEATQARILKVNEVYGEFCNKTQKIKDDIDELEQEFLKHL